MTESTDREFFERIAIAIDSLERKLEGVSLAEFEANPELVSESAFCFGVIMGALSGLDHDNNRKLFSAIEWDRIREMSNAFLCSPAALKPIVTWGFIQSAIPTLKPVVTKALRLF